MQELNALKTLKNPSHGGTSRRSVKLIGDGLLRFGQTGAQPMFGQPIDQQAEHHDQPQRDNALRLFEQDGGSQKQGIFQEAKAAFDAALVFIGAHYFLLSEDALVQDIGGDDETRFAPRFLLDLWLLDGHRCLDVPPHDGSCVLAWSSSACVMLRTEELALHL